MATALTSYGFTATGAPTRRTLPARLNDVLNVKDFGATGNGSTDDTAAINAAIDRAYSLGYIDPSVDFFCRTGAVIYFPPGVYAIGKLVLDRPKTAHGHFAAMRFVGAGRDVSILRGNYSTGNQMDSRQNGFLVEFGAYASQVLQLKDLAIENLSTAATSGACMCMSGPVQVFNCRFKGVIGFYAQACSFGGNIENCVFECSRPITSASAATLSPIKLIPSTSWQSDGLYYPYAWPLFGEGVTNGSCGCFGPGQGVLIGCTATGFDAGFGIAGYGGIMVGCKASRCTVGIMMGYAAGDPTGGGNVGGPDQGAPFTATWGYGTWGWVVFANWCDRCSYGVLSHGGVGAGCYSLSSNSITGDTGPNNVASISTITWSAGTATATTSTAHNLPTGTSKLVLTTNVPGWTPGNTGNEIVSCTRTGTSTFTYSLAQDPGGTGSGTWNYALEYGMVSSGLRGTLYAANLLESVLSSTSFYNDWVKDNTLGNNLMISMRAPYGWSFELPRLAANASTRLASWKFIQCGTPAKKVRALRFTDLPPQPWNVLPPFNTLLFQPVEGDEFNVSDCAAQATFGGTVSAGGSTNHYKLRYNGTNWIRVG